MSDNGQFDCIFGKNMNERIFSLIVAKADSSSDDKVENESMSDNLISSFEYVKVLFFF